MTQTAVQNDIARHVHRLARENRVIYQRGPRDALAENITQLSGDDVRLDETELLLIALQRAGVLTRRDAVRMQADYLRHSRP